MCDVRATIRDNTLRQNLQVLLFQGRILPTVANTQLTVVQKCVNILPTTQLLVINFSAIASYCY